MARKEGTGSVKVYGKVMTQNMYKSAVINTLNELGAKGNGIYVSTDTIISYASNNRWMESKNRKRKAHSHPLYRIMTTLYEEGVVEARWNRRGILEYRLN